MTETPMSNSFFSRAGRVLRNVPRAFGAVFLVSVGTSFYYQYKAFKEYITLPAAFYLDLDLEQQALVERSSNNPLALLTSGIRQLELHNLLQVLHTAKTDERVRGLLAVLGDRQNFGGLAQLQELRNALLDFRFHAKGRAPIYAYSNAFGEGGMNGTGVYYLASAADKVFMPPTSMMSLLGFENTQVFLKDLLDRLKVEPEVHRREEYKAALAPLTGTGFDPAHRENLTSLLQTLYNQVVGDIAAARRLTTSAVEAAISAAPLLPSMATNMGLLDGLLYRDQVEDLLLEQLPAEMLRTFQLQQQKQPQVMARGAAEQLSAQLKGPRVSLQRYAVATQINTQWSAMFGDSSSNSSSRAVELPLQPSGQVQKQQDGVTPANNCAAAVAGATDASSPASSVTQAAPVQQQQQQLGRWRMRSQQALPKPCIVVVTAAGPIMQAAGGVGANPEGTVESHKLVRALRAMRENPQIKAVVLRINSPGGSAVASDMIAREVELLKQAKKPVVACMGDVAASGGYYIAAPASKILAQPGTITGSIGVITARIKVKEALKEYGISGETIKAGENADWASGFHDLTPKQHHQVESMLDETYGNFLAQVARGRGMSLEQVRAVAKGKVWLGSQAVKVGLVDELGGVNRAIEVAKHLAGLPQDVQMLEWPPRRIPPYMMLLKPGAVPEQPTPAMQATWGSALTSILGQAFWHIRGEANSVNNPFESMQAAHLATKRLVPQTSLGAGALAAARSLNASSMGVLSMNIQQQAQLSMLAAQVFKAPLAADMLCIEATLLSNSC